MNETWYSTDGVNWFQPSGTPFTPARALQSSVTYNNAIWIIAGYPYPGFTADVWHGP